MVSWTAFYRLHRFSAAIRISASYKATVTALQVAEAFREEEGMLHARGVLETTPRAYTDSPRLIPRLLQEGLLLNLIGLLRTGRAGKRQLQGYLYSILDCNDPPKQG